MCFGYVGGCILHNIHIWYNKNARIISMDAAARRWIDKSKLNILPETTNILFKPKSKYTKHHL